MSKFSTIKSSMSDCMGFVDNLCCASLQHVNEEGGFCNNNNNNNNDNDNNKEKRHRLKTFFASYDLSYLNNNLAVDESSSSSSSSSSLPPSNSLLADDGEFSRKDTYPISNTKKDRGSSTVSASSSPSIPLLHTILPNSMLPQDYGMTSHVEEEEEGGGGGERRQGPLLGDEDSCCHSCPEMFEEQEQRYNQPHVLSPSDTYTTVASAQSYMWDDDDEEEEEEEREGNDNQSISTLGSVFRQNISNVEGEEEEEEKVTSSNSISTKTHEAYQYLLRMKPQNYLHYGGDGYDYDDYTNNHCGLFHYYNINKEEKEV